MHHIKRHYILRTGILLGASILLGFTLRDYQQQQASTMIYGPPSASIQPSNTIIAFDLHGVLFSFSKELFVRRALQTQQKGQLFLFGINPLFWYKLYQACKQTRVVEGIYYRLLDDYPQLAHSKMDFLALSNAQLPQHDTIELVDALKRKGYTLALCSNIGQETFEQLCAEFPAIFERFNLIFTATARNNYISKIHPEFYANFKQFLIEQGYVKHHVFFIDDKKKNINFALEYGMSGILFHTPQQLKMLLQKEGLLV